MIVRAGGPVGESALVQAHDTQIVPRDADFGLRIRARFENGQAGGQ